jgi:hypothetical protein
MMHRESRKIQKNFYYLLFSMVLFLFHLYRKIIIIIKFSQLGSLQKENVNSGKNFTFVPKFSIVEIHDSSRTVHIANHPAKAHKLNRIMIAIRRPIRKHSDWKYPNFKENSNLQIDSELLRLVQV